MERSRAFTFALLGESSSRHWFRAPLRSLLVVVGISIGVDLRVAAIDRRRELGVLRAIGATQRQVTTAIVVEAGFLGFCAVVASAVLGWMSRRGSCGRSS